MLALLLAAAAAGEDIDSIRSLRARSNAALAAHRVEDLRPLLTEGYTAFPGSSGRPFTAEQLEQRLASAFADPTFATYVRTPKRIVVAASGKRAAETGTWLGLWRKSDGEMRLTGIYQATWVPRDGGWRLLNESFVTLRCTGSRACTEID
jgi:hypothetical protein